MIFIEKGIRLMNKASQSEAVYTENSSRKHQRSRIDYGKPMCSKDAGHPFEMCVATVAPGKTLCAYHAHMTQWEFYYVLEGSGHMRLDEGNIPIKQGDAMMCPPMEAHQLVNDNEDDLVVQIVATNQPFDACIYPDFNIFASKHLGAFSTEQTSFPKE